MSSGLGVETIEEINTEMNRMSWPKVKIGDVTDKVLTWNPLKSTSNESFLYVDLSAIDREKKQ